MRWWDTAILWTDCDAAGSWTAAIAAVLGGCWRSVGYNGLPKPLWCGGFVFESTSLNLFNSKFNSNYYIYSQIISLNYCHYLYHLILHRNSIIFIHFTRYFPWYPFCCIKFDQHFADRCTWFVIASVVEMILSGWGRFQFRDSARMTNGRGQMSPVIWSGWHASENSKNGICCISISRATEQEWMKKKKTTAYSTTTAQTPGSYCAPVCEYIRSL